MLQQQTNLSAGFAACLAASVKAGGDAVLVEALHVEKTEDGKRKKHATLFFSAVKQKSVRHIQILLAHSATRTSGLALKELLGQLSSASAAPYIDEDSLRDAIQHFVNAKPADRPVSLRVGTRQVTKGRPKRAENADAPVLIHCRNEACKTTCALFSLGS